MLPDGGISTVGQRTGLLRAQTSHIEFVSTERLSPSPAVQHATCNHHIHQSECMISKHFLLGLEGAETVLDDTPDNLKIVGKSKHNESYRKKSPKIKPRHSCLSPPRAKWAGLALSVGIIWNSCCFAEFVIGHSIARRLNVLDIGIGILSQYW